MDRESIAQVLDSIPSEFLSQPRFVRHFFYGPLAKLRRIRTQLKRSRVDPVFDFGDAAMTAIVVEQLTLNALGQSVEELVSFAHDFGIEYDGFEVILNEQEIQAPLKPFEKYFAPGTYVRFPLGEDRFGYILFLGGNMKDGYIFDCLSLVDEGNSSPDTLDVAPRLYRQPVLGAIDPLRVEAIGRGQPIQYPLRIRFRMGTGFPTPEEVAAAAMEQGLEHTDQNWPLILERLAAAKKTLRCGQPYEFIATLKSSNRIEWNDGPQIHVFDGSEPMLFGSHARLESLAEALVGKYDTLALHDAVM
jgi:hypothetical protein